MLKPDHSVSMHEMWKRKQIYKDARIMSMTKIVVKKCVKTEDAPFVECHDLVRRMDRQ